ncbi:MAG: hypothetical protein A2622_13055 [Bdellovibrionales bacterium RIFCSPHIGHO2_01_FULL_40_29]|nr:MAG: hypothetical protein A2622_13055 [Bdellovibrionales bacterium RIFCSPHIGHO2_01_FULL_40_29]OFZ33381.1 MAG: hypothetical protein A3D17_13830 [Bdellovibrionales bacterium RIFCSPHIGHO2_02_FULL_40_15]
MSLQSESKINQLITAWPDGAIMTTAWLEKKGLTRQLLYKYKQSGWIEGIGPGAYKKMDDSISWLGGVEALQKQVNLKIHVGGRTALDLHGKAHYLKFGKATLTLIGKSGYKLPTWFKNYSWNTEINFASSNLFEELDENFGKKIAGYTVHSSGRISITISSAERAILEFLDQVPQENEYDEALKIMEGLTSLRTGLLQELLEKCKSVKVKRLFLHLANRINHSWFQKLNQSRIELGAGKRLIYKNGYYDSKYRITVPEEAREPRSV